MDRTEEEVQRKHRDRQFARQIDVRSQDTHFIGYANRTEEQSTV